MIEFAGLVLWKDRGYFWMFSLLAPIWNLHTSLLLLQVQKSGQLSVGRVTDSAMPP